MTEKSEPYFISNSDGSKDQIRTQNLQKKGNITPTNDAKGKLYLGSFVHSSF